MPAERGCSDTRAPPSAGDSGDEIRNYLASLEQFAKWFEKTPGETFRPEVITALDVVGYKSHLVQKEYQPASINTKLASLSKFCGWAKDRGFLEENPAAEIKRVRQEQPTTLQSLDRKERLKLLRTVHQSCNKGDIALVELIGNTGLRAAEVAALKRFGYQTVGVSVVQTAFPHKGGEERFLYPIEEMIKRKKQISRLHELMSEVAVAARETPKGTTYMFSVHGEIVPCQ